MITKSKVIELFCMTYDFCKFFYPGPEAPQKIKCATHFVFKQGCMAHNTKSDIILLRIQIQW